MLAQVTVVTPPHLVTSASQHDTETEQLAASLVQSVVLTLAFAFHPAGQVGVPHLALVGQQAVALVAAVAAVFFHASVA